MLRYGLFAALILTTAITLFMVTVTGRAFYVGHVELSIFFALVTAGWALVPINMYSILKRKNIVLADIIGD